LGAARVNLAAMAAVGALSGGLARASGHHALWGLLIAAYPGFAYSLSLDLTEIVATACLLAGLLALRRRRYRAATIALVLAVLTRETTVIVPVGVLLAWGWGPNARHNPLAAKAGCSGGRHCPRRAGSVRCLAGMALAPMGRPSPEPVDRRKRTVPTGGIAPEPQVLHTHRWSGSLPDRLPRAPGKRRTCRDRVLAPLERSPS
jgi:hypothetical protein